MAMQRISLRRIGLASTVPRGRGIFIPRSGYIGGGGEYGAPITDEARAFAILREPVAFRIVYTVANDIFDNWFNLKLKEGREKESEAFDQKIQAKLSNLNAKFELTRAATFERGFGWSLLVLGYKDCGETLADPLQDPEDLLDMKAYPKTQITSIKKERNKQSRRYGLPKIYYIQQEGLASRLKVHYTRVIHCAARLYRESDWEGKSVLDNFWDDLVTLRNIRWAMGQTMYRYGSGFFDFTFTGAEKEKIQEWEDAGLFKNITNRSYFAHNEQQTIDVKGFAGKAINPQQYYLPIMEQISAASGIPLAILRGVQAGALTGSEVNEREYWNIISDAQSAYEPFLRDLINIILQLEKSEEQLPITQLRPTIPDWTFQWKSGFELTEEQKLDIESKRLDNIRKKVELANFTQNQVRKMIDPNLPELSKEQGGEEIVVPRGLKGFSEGDSYLVTPMQRNRERSSRQRN